MNRAESAAFVQKLNAVADRRHLRVVPVDPHTLSEYLETKSYELWEQDELEGVTDSYL